MQMRLDLFAMLALLLRIAHAEDLTSGTFQFADIEAFYQMIDVPKKDCPIVLLLHGAKFSSDDWVGLGTLKLLQTKGYRTAAVDLPGYGKTRNLPYVDNNMRAEFLKTALDFFGKGSNVTTVGAILVTPSMSGRWAIPFLDRYGMMLKGWVPIAPAGVMEWGGPWEFTHKTVRLMAVYGENDAMRAQADNLMKLFRLSKKVIIPNARHACYKDNPSVFHQHLTAFVDGALSPDRKDDY